MSAQGLPPTCSASVNDGFPAGFVKNVMSPGFAQSLPPRLRHFAIVKAVVILEIIHAPCRELRPARAAGRLGSQSTTP